MRNLTASGLWRAEACPASAVLPQVQAVHADAVAGTAAHAALEAEVSPGERAEVALAYNVETGEARELPRKEHRAYPEQWEHAWVFGTVDRLRLDPEIEVTDHKTGFGYMVAPARSNVQLAFGAVAAARLRQRDAAMVQILGEGRKPDVAVLGPMELDLAAERLRRIVMRVRVAKIAHDEGQTDGVVTGPHCWRCPAFARCPAQTSLAVALAGGLDQRELPTLELTAEGVAKGWKRLKEIKAVLGAVEAAYRGYAALTPVPLGDGKTLGPVESSREMVDGKTALKVLTALHGREVAEAACEVETSKAAIKRALATVSPKGTLAGAERAALDAIRAESGITTKTTQRVEEY